MKNQRIVYFYTDKRLENPSIKGSGYPTKSGEKLILYNTRLIDVIVISYISNKWEKLIYLSNSNYKADMSRSVVIKLIFCD